MERSGSDFAMFILKCVSDLNFQRGSFGWSVINGIWIPTLDASKFRKNRIRLLLGEPKEEDSLSFLSFELSQKSLRMGFPKDQWDLARLRVFSFSSYFVFISSLKLEVASRSKC
jgi:hypothetical protein